MIFDTHPTAVKLKRLGVGERDRLHVMTWLLCQPKGDMLLVRPGKSPIRVKPDGTVTVGRKRCRRWWTRT